MPRFLITIFAGFWAVSGLCVLSAGAQTLDENTCAIARAKTCDVDAAIKRGMIETGLVPVFPKGASCPQIDEAWAINYTGKRAQEAFHGGIDMPAKTGTPIVASADGEVVAVFKGTNSYRGIEIVLRHSPQQTGLPYWTFSAYSHFSKMPSLSVGAKVKMGQVLGPTGNSGRGKEPFIQSSKRRPAIHYAVVYSASPDFRITKNEVVVPKNARWADPNAFVAGMRQLDSYELRKLPASKKQVQVGVMMADGAVLPKGARIIWPYLCH